MDLKTVTKNLPPEALQVLEEAGYFAPDQLEVGSTPPVLALASREDGRLVQIGGSARGRPTILIFGSYT